MTLPTNEARGPYAPPTLAEMQKAVIDRLFFYYLQAVGCEEELADRRASEDVAELHAATLASLQPTGEVLEAAIDAGVESFKLPRQYVNERKADRAIDVGIVVRAAAPILLAAKEREVEKVKAELQKANDFIAETESALAYEMEAYEAQREKGEVEEGDAPVHELARRLVRAESQVAALEGALKELLERGLDYRSAHDIQGDGSPDAGYAWDQWRKSEAKARTLLDRRDP